MTTRKKIITILFTAHTAIGCGGSTFSAGTDAAEPDAPPTPDAEPIPTLCSEGETPYRWEVIDARTITWTSQLHLTPTQFLANGDRELDFGIDENGILYSCHSDDSPTLVTVSGYRSTKVYPLAGEYVGMSRIIMFSQAELHDLYGGTENRETYSAAIEFRTFSGEQLVGPGVGKVAVNNAVGNKPVTQDENGDWYVSSAPSKYSPYVVVYNIPLGTELKMGVDTFGENCVSRGAKEAPSTSNPVQQFLYYCEP